MFSAQLGFDIKQSGLAPEFRIVSWIVTDLWNKGFERRENALIVHLGAQLVPAIDTKVSVLYKQFE